MNLFVRLYDQLVKFLADYNENIFELNEKEFVENVINVFDNAKLIVDDLYITLDDIMQYIKSDFKTVGECVEYINRKRLPFKSLRKILRSQLKMSNYYNIQNVDVKIFAIGIVGILQGGIHPRSKKYFSDLAQHRTGIYLNRHHNVIDYEFLNKCITEGETIPIAALQQGHVFS